MGKGGVLVWVFVCLEFKGFKYFFRGFYVGLVLFFWVE